MNYKTRLNIKIKDYHSWMKLKDFDLDKYGLNINIDKLFFTKKYNFVQDGLNLDEENLRLLIIELNKILKDNCVIIADTTKIINEQKINIRINPLTHNNYCTYCVCLIDNQIFIEDAKNKEKLDINNINKWILIGKFPLSERKINILRSFK